MRPDICNSKHLFHAIGELSQEYQQQFGRNVPSDLAPAPQASCVEQSIARSGFVAQEIAES